MKLAILLLRTTPISIRHYVEAIQKRLPGYGIDSIVFDDPGCIPLADLYWDPRTGGGRAPTTELATGERPLVATLHDVAHLSLPWREFYPTRRAAIQGWLEAVEVKRKWRQSIRKVCRVIVPSETSRREAAEYLGIPHDLITVIPHGVERTLYDRKASSAQAALVDEPYFLHVSHYQPRKNIERILAAYRSLSREDRPRLVLKLFGFNRSLDVEGVTLIQDFLPDEEIAALYTRAVAFVFPSVNEGFGLPILEAMACGCPVITSSGTACSEVAGDAALCVDPYSVEEIARAMEEIAGNAQLRDYYRNAGYARLRKYSWEASAAKHAEVFRLAVV